jgi:hypothetical protein
MTLPKQTVCWRHLPVCGGWIVGVLSVSPALEEDRRKEEKGRERD